MGGWKHQGNRVTFFIDFRGGFPTVGHISARKLSLFPTRVSR